MTRTRRSRFWRRRLLSTRRTPRRTRSSRVHTTRVRSSSPHRLKAGAFVRTLTSPWRRHWISTRTLPRRTWPAVSSCGRRRRDFHTSRPSDRSRKPWSSTPDADETHHQLSLVYSHVGLLDEAQSHVARAIDLNPNNTMARFRVGVYATWQCRFEDALAVLKTVPSDVSPFLVDRVRAEVYVQLGRLGQGPAHHRRLSSPGIPRMRAEA